MAREKTENFFSFRQFSENRGVQEQPMEKNTLLSSCRQYRFRLWREIDPLNPRYVVFIGLNPSTADEFENDPTLDRCISYAKKWEMGSLCLVNLFALRTPFPAVLRRRARGGEDPIGASNNQHIAASIAGAAKVVPIWGSGGFFMKREAVVRRMLSGAECLGFNGDESPRHPLARVKFTGLQPFPQSRAQ